MDEKGHRPPHSLDAEKSVLGAMLLDQELAVEALDGLNTNDFFDRKHRRIFQACRDLDSKNSVTDMVTVGEELSRKKILEEAGGIEYIASLTDDIPLLSNVLQYIKIIKDKAMLRQLIKVSRENINEVLEGTDDVENVLDAAASKIMAITETRASGEFKPLAQLVSRGIEELENLRNTKGYVTGLSTGFTELDKMTTGFHSGELIILAARPGIGKTSMALNMATHIASETERAVAIFSLEMSDAKLTQRMLCADAHIGTKPIIEGTLSQNAWYDLQAAADRLQRMKIFIDDKAGIGSMEVRAKVRSLKRREDLCMVFVDYLQLMRSDGNSENRQQEIARITGDLKALSKEMELPVMALSQLSRMATKRSGTPRLSDLRESGAIEQDADLVMFLHQPEIHADQDGEYEGQIDFLRRETVLKIGKQRNGPLGMIDLIFKADITRFFPVDQDGLE
ncbi:MAG: replicative DNA helicase [Candidatus Aegiribacteria sp.]|nr:replicative DNA helicase [Candidatus Aegiribacteria sp.]